MSQTGPTKDPARPGRRGNYALAAADFSLPQQWEQYSADEHDIWRLLYQRQIGLVREYGAVEVLDGLEVLGTSAAQIPDFAAVNRQLSVLTGWRIVAVPGLLPDEPFYAHLAARCFPVSVWIRERSELDYLVEPDLFHDFFGHVPLLANPVFARFMQAYGAAGPKAVAHDAVSLLARLYWYTVEFGLIRSGSGLKAFGAGILSSKSETLYSVTSPVPHRLDFDLARVMRTAYRSDALQRCYFVLESFEQLFHAGYDTDFAPLYEQLRGQTALAPDQLEAGDRPIAALALRG